MKVRGIKVGGYYVGKQEDYYIRHVMATELGDFYFRTFERDTGKPAERVKRASPIAMAMWAGREATPEEIARMQVGYAEEDKIRRGYQMITDALALASDIQLFSECRRRRMF